VLCLIELPYCTIIQRLTRLISGFHVKHLGLTVPSLLMSLLRSSISSTRTLRTVLAIRKASITSDADRNAVEFFYKVHKNPSVYKALNETSLVLAEKGILGGPDLSMQQQLLLVADSDIRTAMDRVKKELKNADIPVTLDIIRDFFSFFREKKEYEVK